MMLSEQIGTAAHQVLEKTPPELAGDIYRNGVMLTGGGAQLHGLTEYLAQELKVEVTVSPDPVNCVALGTAMSLGIGDKLETGFTDATPRIGRREECCGKKENLSIFVELNGKIRYTIPKSCFRGRSETPAANR